MRIREYSPADERGWLQCRLMGFFDTDYYDDVQRERPVLAPGNIELVAEDDSGDIVGILSIEVDGAAATIDTVAVHPSARRSGAATALLDAALARLPRDVRTLDAWTREDAAANAWYAASGFTEQHRYLHVYKGHDEPDDGFTTPDGLSAPVIAFMHAKIERETELRARYARVYVCRQYLREL